MLAYGYTLANGNATYAWDGTSWMQVGDTDAALRSGATLVSDREGHVLLFGGETVTCGGPGVCNATAQNDTWTWNGTTWVERLVEQPSPRLGARAALDTAHGTIVMVGGRYIDNANETDYQETWEYDGFHWTSFAGGPWTTGKYGAAIAYDSGRDEMVVFGGGPLVGGSVPGETWIRTNGSWTHAAPAQSPNELVDAAMAFDVDRKRVVMFGGSDLTSSTSATWLWNGTTWTNAQPAVSPPPRVGAALAWDPIAREVVLFGGQNSFSQFVQDTWSWDGTTWHRRMIDSAPPGRRDAQLSWDATRKALVLFGGENSSGALNDAWEWSAGAWQPIVAVNSPPTRTDHAQAPLPDGTGVFVFGGEVSSAANSSGLLDLFDFWRLRWEAPVNYEVCEQHVDHDGDGLFGCDDPDCWARCTPACPPGATCDAAAPSCGDHSCNAALEDCRTCPTDCTTCLSLCGDALCDASETATACPGDCTP